jgi:hypothetical protein
MNNKATYILLDSGTEDTWTKCPICKQTESWSGEFRRSFETDTDFFGYVEDFYGNEHICAFRECHNG